MGFKGQYKSFGNYTDRKPILQGFSGNADQGESLMEEKNLLVIGGNSGIDL